jgi:phosphate regulon transcriptional regulator PhoB
MSASILVVEDEPSIQELISVGLTRNGHEVRRAATAEEAYGAVAAALPDVILLDWMLPDASGPTFARRLRSEQRTKEVPIIMLTARAGDDDKVAGLEAGADDYVTKPFSPRELVARVKTVLRRARGAEQASPLLAVGRVRLDPDRRRAYVGDAEVPLTTTEFDLLAFLLRRPGRVYEREHLLSEVWGYAAAAGTRTVDVHVAQLRAKLGDASPIRTVRGVGYSAEAP